jgi:CRP-like cAMP-binding protein
LFYIRRGKVKLTVISQQGKEAIIAILNAGEFFGARDASPGNRYVRQRPSR